MRYCFFVLAWLLLHARCKKETTSFYAPTAAIMKEETGSKPNCTGNTWQMDHDYFTAQCANAPNELAPLVFNNKAYVIHPGNGGQVEVKVFDGSAWTSLSSTVPDTYPLCQAYFGFVIGDKGYLAGHAATFEYSFETNSWSIKAAFPGGYRTHAATFAVGGKGYVVGGSSLTNSTTNYFDTWEFDPALNQWQEKSSLPRGAARTATGFSVNNKGYIINGFYKNNGAIVFLKDLFEYDPVADTWIYKSFFPGDARRNTCVFILGGQVYAGAGRGSYSQHPYGAIKDFFKYNPVNNSWQQVADLAHFDVKDVSKYGFTINNRGYVAFANHTGDPDYLLKYTPLSCVNPFKQ